MFSVLRGGKQCNMVSSSDQYISITFSGLRSNLTTVHECREWNYCESFAQNILFSSAHWTVRILQNFKTNVFPISQAKRCYKKLKPYLEKSAHVWNYYICLNVEKTGYLRVLGKMSRISKGFYCTVYTKSMSSTTGCSYANKKCNSPINVVDDYSIFIFD